MFKVKNDISDIIEVLNNGSTQKAIKYVDNAMMSKSPSGMLDLKVEVSKGLEEALNLKSKGYGICKAMVLLSSACLVASTMIYRNDAKQYAENVEKYKKLADEMIQGIDAENDSEE